MARLARGWEDLRQGLILTGGEAQETLAVALDLAGPRRWRPAIWRRCGRRR